jgi:peptide/nickel transport system permease protein
LQGLAVLLPTALSLSLLPRLGRLQDRGIGDAALVGLTLVALPLVAWVGAHLDARRLRAPATGVAHWERVLHALLANRLAMTGVMLLALRSVCALLAPILAPHDPFTFAKLGLEAPGPEHWLGTDAIGRDVLSRLLYGARISLMVGFVAVFLAVLIGTTVGLVAGYVGGLVDAALMRLVDLLIAFPRIFLALLIIALWGPSIWLVIGVLGLTGWMATARLVRSQVLSLREQEYVEAARALGLPLRRILSRHVLPNAAAPVVVSATLMVGNAILAESVLSFLGLGVQVPVPSWGAMLNEARGAWHSAWWLATFPGVAITLTVMGYNLLGDGLRDALDPHLPEEGVGDRG